jgi:hypothetical protein
LSLKDFRCYRCPIVSDNFILGFSTVKKRVTEKESRITHWEMTGLGQGTEREVEYYDLIKQYPVEEGYRFYAISFDWPSKLFFLLLTPSKEYLILPASKTSINFLITFTGRHPEDDFVPLDQVLPVINECYENRLN